MKVLVAYYSRTNKTFQLAEDIQKEFSCDLEEIIDIKSRSGISGWIKSGYEAMRQIPAEIKPLKNDPSDYDLVIIGTPVWADSPATPILTYINDNKSKFNEVSFFCTCGGSGYEKTFAKMEEYIGKKPLETLFMTKSDMEQSYTEKLKNFTSKIKNKVH